MEIAAEGEAGPRSKESFKPHFLCTLSSVNRWTDFKVVFTERLVCEQVCASYWYRLLSERERESDK